MDFHGDLVWCLQLQINESNISELTASHTLSGPLSCVSMASGCSCGAFGKPQAHTLWETMLQHLPARTKFCYKELPLLHTINVLE